MPTYAYRCDKCGVRFDRVEFFGQAADALPGM